MIVWLQVSVANSELTGLIKIAESLRIKGLGDVSQRDPTPSSRPEKRSATPSAFSTASSPNSCGRPRKAARLAHANGGTSDSKNQEGDFPTLIPGPFGLRPQSFSHLLEGSVLHPAADGDQDSRDSNSPPFKESKLRSYLEAPDLPLSHPLTNLLAQPPGTSRLGGLLKKEADRKRSQRIKVKQGLSDPLESEKEEKVR